MAARAIWKGVIRFSDVQVPVKLYSAIEDRAVHFRMLHAKDQVPVRQRMVDPETEEVVERADAQRGYPMEPGLFVLLRDQELQELTPPASRDIEIRHFVPDGQLGHAWLDRPYFLGPDGDVADFTPLLHALRNTGRTGIAHWVMRKKRYHGALFARGEQLVLMTLRTVDQVAALPSLKVPERPLGNRREMALAEQLIAALEDRFDPQDYQDTYRERLLQYLEHKAAGQRVTLRRVEKRPPVRPLSKVLEESLQVVKEKKIA